MPIMPGSTSESGMMGGSSAAAGDATTNAATKSVFANMILSFVKDPV
jgi:hypothetical protein